MNMFKRMAEEALHAMRVRSTNGSDTKWRTMAIMMSISATAPLQEQKTYFSIVLSDVSVCFLFSSSMCATFWMAKLA